MDLYITITLFVAAWPFNTVNLVFMALLHQYWHFDRPIQFGIIELVMISKQFVFRCSISLELLNLALMHTMARILHLFSLHKAAQRAVLVPVNRMCFLNVWDCTGLAKVALGEF